LKENIRIASGQGFWGDWLDAPVKQVERGGIDYLVMDYLAEVTMSIMQKQRSRNSKLGYARDFVPLMEQLLPNLVKKKIKVVANAGGVNPQACAKAVLESAKKLGLAGKVKVAIVTGDDMLGRLGSLTEAGHKLTNLDTGAHLKGELGSVMSANAYLGAWPIVKALEKGADIIITGRVTDTGLTLGPMIHEFGWKEDDWDKMAIGTVAGHMIECGAQSSGGNCLIGWERIPGMVDPGYPIIEAHSDGTFFVTKHDGTGGRVSVPSVTEQLVYEMGDPQNYITPDCVADFTSIQLKQAGKDRVKVTGVKGKPATEFLKVSLSYFYGYKAVGTLVYSWPEAFKKAKRADQILRGRLEALGLEFEEILTEYVGHDSTHGRLAGKPDPDMPEVQLRIGVRSKDRKSVERFSRELAPLILNGPPSVTGFAGGRPKVEEIVAYWPALIPKKEIRSRVKVLG
jgi:hypothetical protein